MDLSMHLILVSFVFYLEIHIDEREDHETECGHRHPWTLATPCGCAQTFQKNVHGSLEELRVGWNTLGLVQRKYISWQPHQYIHRRLNEPQNKSIANKLKNEKKIVDNIATPILKTSKKSERRAIREYKKKPKEELAMRQDKGSSSNWDPELVELKPFAIRNQLECILKEFPKANATVETIGRTVEYNDIVLLKITQDSSVKESFRAKEEKYVDEEEEKKIIFIVHGLSVRGINSMPCFRHGKYFAMLLGYYLEHLHHFDIFIIPMANPDGIFVERECWNKNMSPGDACPGVDLDRNFDVAWNASQTGSSCNPHYPGKYPFSEPESRAIRDVFHRYSHKIIAYIHAHSSSCTDKIFKGDAILYPKGYTDLAADDDKYLDLKGEIYETIRNAGFEVLSVAVDTLYNWYGLVSGTSVDYAATVYGVPYAMEFAMQMYNEPNGHLFARMPEYTGNYSIYALMEIWSRVIDVTFNQIYKSTQATNEVK